ncbi:MAG TPA: hypothetical protein PKA20_02665 [Burkholderiaceae bacterium]|nr:hypothetical protein [Burkholderiaceae bacterium]
MTARTEAVSGRFPGTLADWLAYTPFFATTFLAKWGVPVGPRDLGMSVMLILLALIIGLSTQRMRVDTRQFIAYLLMLAVLGAFQLLGAREFSFLSFLLMMALYLCYTVRVERPGDSGRRAMHFVADCGAFVAACGIVQFASQFVLPYNLVFPIETLVPQHLQIEGYNTQIPLTYGSTIYKANGYFCLEPSFFSQLLAITLLIELVTRNRLSRIALVAAGLAVSYSGTGIIILMVCLPVLVIARRRWDLIVLGAVVLVAGSLLSDKLNLDLFLQRASEFSNPRSSGFERFVGGFYLFEQYLWQDVGHALTGYGAGTFQDYADRAEHRAAEISFFKIVFEFGILGAILNLGFLFYTVFRSSAPPVIKLAVAVAYFMSGIYTATSHGFALTLLLWPGARDTATGGRGLFGGSAARAGRQRVAAEGVGS